MRKMKGAWAAAATVASTPGDPSAFMTTTDQPPSSVAHSSVSVPPPVLEAAQMPASAGGAGTELPACGA